MKGKHKPRISPGLAKSKKMNKPHARKVLAQLVKAKTTLKSSKKPG